MAVPREYLESLASTFTVVRDGPQFIQPGQPVAVRLVPASTADLRATDLLPAALRLTWITKNVRFNTHAVEPSLEADPFTAAGVNALLAGGMPARVPAVGSIVGTESLQGVPGQLAQLAGSFPVPVEVPVKLSVNWEVLDADAMTVLAAGPSTFDAPTGTAAAEATFVFPPVTVEMTNAMAVPTARRFLRATVTLTAGTTPPYTFTLPPVPVDIPAIPVPTVAAFFLHRNFAARSGDDEGAAFVVVPNNSPFRDLASLQPALDRLSSTLSPLTSVASFASLLLGLNELTSALAAQPHVQFRVADAANNYDDFNDVTLKHHWLGFLFGWSNTEAEDEMSSLIFVGAQGKRLDCFNHRGRNASGGHFALITGAELHATVRNLHSASPTSGPAGTEISTPPIVTPPGGISVAGSSPGTFGDELSSLSFT